MRSSKCSPRFWGLKASQLLCAARSLESAHGKPCSAAEGPVLPLLRICQPLRNYQARLWLDLKFACSSLGLITNLSPVFWRKNVDPLSCRALHSWACRWPSGFHWGCVGPQSRSWHPRTDQPSQALAGTPSLPRSSAWTSVAAFEKLLEGWPAQWRGDLQAKQLKEEHCLWCPPSSW